MAQKNPDERARELHDLHEYARTKRHTTTSVGNTQEGTSIVGTNEPYLRKDLKKGLMDHEISAKSLTGNHAEENVMDEADAQELKITEIGASRPICIDCETKIKQKGILSHTIFSGKKSNKRK